MSQMRVPLEWATDRCVRVEDIDGTVYLDLREFFDPDGDPARDVGLTAAEARTVAAALLHCASEVE